LRYLALLGWKYLRFIWADKAAQNWRLRVMMVPGIGYASKCFLHTLGVIEELKSPCDSGALWGNVKKDKEPELLN
jgi:hypothetical protein